MPAKNIVAIKRAGFIIPDAFLKVAVKEATWLGTTLIHEGKLIVDHQASRPTVESVGKLVEAMKDRTVVLVFGANKTINPEDMQPFDVLVDKDSDTHVGVTLEGSFESYAVKNSTHTNEWHCKEEFLAKKLPKLYKSANAGLDGLISELNDPITQQDFSNSWTDRGMITFLTTKGDAITVVNKGHVFKSEYSWGMVSDGLGYKEDAPKVEAKKEDKPLTLLEKLQLKAKGIATPVATPEGVVEQHTAASMKLLDALNGDKFEDVKLPAEAKDWTNKQKVTWWVGEVGYKPDRYKELNTVVKRTKGTKQGILAPLASTNVSEKMGDDDDEGDKTVPFPKGAVDPKTLPDKIPAAPAPENFKDTAPKHILMENMPILSPKQKLLLRKEWMTDSEVVKTLGDDMKALAFDPKRLKEFEDNYQTFYDGLGMDKNTWLSFEALLKLGANDLKALAIYAFNRQNDNAAARNSLKAILANPNNKIAERKLAM